MPAKSSNVDLDTFNKLVSSIYDAAMDTTLWPEVIQQLADSLNAPSGMLRVQNWQTKQVGTCITHELDPDFQQRYKEHFVHIDPLMSALARHETGAIIQTATEMPESYKKTEFFNDYIAKQGMDHIIGCTVIENNSQVAILGIQRPEQAGYYKQRESALLDLLIPHIQRALQVNSHLLQLTNKADAACDSLHRLYHGVILVDESGIPIFINSKAETMVANGCGLKISRHGLQGPKYADTLALRKLIFDASKSPEKMGGILSICDPSSMQPLSILVTPINKDNGFDFGINMPQAAAALFIGDTGQQHDFSLDMLGSFYGLTHAEARLAGALANGYSLEKIAEKFKVSKHTIRSQLKSCFQKTGVNRQTELVKLIWSGPTVLVNDEYL